MMFLTAKYDVFVYHVNVYHCHYASVFHSLFTSEWQAFLLCSLSSCLSLILCLSVCVSGILFVHVCL